MDNNLSYERDETIARAGRLLGNLGLAFAIFALLPSLLHVFASILAVVFTYIIFFLINLVLILITLGLILLAGNFPPIKYSDIFGGTEISLFGELSGAFFAVVSIMGIIACALAVFAIIIGKRMKGVEGAKAAAGRGIAAISVTAVALVLTVISVVMGGGL